MVTFWGKELLTDKVDCMFFSVLCLFVILMFPVHCILCMQFRPSSEKELLTLFTLGSVCNQCSCI